jgi:hypothetical protein
MMVSVNTYVVKKMKPMKGWELFKWIFSSNRLVTNNNKRLVNVPSYANWLYLKLGS